MGVVTSCSFELSMIRVVDKPWFLLKKDVEWKNIMARRLKR
jgi:hypothetical protein